MRGYWVGGFVGVAVLGGAIKMDAQAATLTAIAEALVGAMELAVGHARLHQTQNKDLGPDVGFDQAMSANHHWDSGVAYDWEYQFTGSVIVFKLGATTVTTPASLADAATGFVGSLRNLRFASDEAYDHHDGDNDEDDDDDHKGGDKDKDKHNDKDRDDDNDKDKNKNKDNNKDKNANKSKGSDDNNEDDEDKSKSVFAIPSDLALFFSIDEINGQSTGLSGFTLLLGDSLDFAYNADLGDAFTLKGAAKASWSGELKHSPNQNFALSIGAFTYDDPTQQAGDIVPADNDTDDEGRNARAAPSPSALALLLTAGPMLWASRRRRRG